VPTPPEVAWFSALCDDDYEFLGVADDGLASSWDHCRAITIAADSAGYDSILLPSGYALGIDSVAFAAAVATQTRRINLLLAVRMGELVVPQLARQLATIDQISGGRLVLNVISSDVPGEVLPCARSCRGSRCRRRAVSSTWSSTHRGWRRHRADAPRSTSAGCPRRPRPAPPRAPMCT
jgi:alkanesulfonate monooxygenase SsuD/methylene tetrahydromethanopterin reductase-like flavin-dependent oxidoreductase (luciferase family)